jgi:hypothetical protein
MELKPEWFFDDDPIVVAREECYDRRSELLKHLRIFCTYLPPVKSFEIKHISTYLYGSGSILISYDFWLDLMSDVNMTPGFEPNVIKPSVIEDGLLGTLYNYNLITDGYFDTEDRVLESGEAFIGVGVIAYTLDEILSEMTLAGRNNVIRIVR